MKEMIQAFEQRFFFQDSLFRECVTAKENMPDKKVFVLVPLTFQKIFCPN